MNYTDLGYDRFLSKDIFSVDSKVSTVELLSQLVSGAITNTKIADNAITDSKVESLTADKITAGTITASVSVGSNNLLMDGVNTRYVVSDGTDNRIVMGYLEGAF